MKDQSKDSTSNKTNTLSKAAPKRSLAKKLGKMEGEVCEEENEVEEEAGDSAKAIEKRRVGVWILSHAEIEELDAGDVEIKAKGKFREESEAEDGDDDRVCCG
jgi:hypothetical protein